MVDHRRQVIVCLTMSVLDVENLVYLDQQLMSSGPFLGISLQQTVTQFSEGFRILRINWRICTLETEKKVESQFVNID